MSEISEILPEYLDHDFTHCDLNLGDVEALIDELMALVDFGQAIREPYVQIVAERCPRILMNKQEGGSSG